MAKPSGKQSGKKSNKKSNARYTIIVFWATFLVSAFLALTIELVLAGITNFILPVVMLLSVIFVGIVFDALGMSVTVANIATFNAKAARKMRGAKEATFLIKNADKMANIFNDVIGDICGVLSGSLGSAIVLVLFIDGNTMAAAIIAGIVSALTVGGKSIGKTIALSQADQIVWKFAQILSIGTLIKEKIKK